MKIKPFIMRSQLLGIKRKEKKQTTASVNSFQIAFGIAPNAPHSGALTNPVLLTNQQQGFTKTELLVALAIVAVVCAILFPVVQSFQNKNQNRKLQEACVSREHQLSLALTQYVQDNDQTYPWSYSISEDTAGWTTLIQPYLNKATGNETVKPDTAVTCPAAGTPASSYSVNGQIICLYDIEHKSPGESWYNSVVRTSRVSIPHDTVLLADAILGSSVDTSLPVPGRRSAGEFAYPHPANTKDHTEDKGWDMDWFGIGYNNHQISWRHSGGANVVFCDGHAMYARPGDLKDANWDVRCQYGQACEGSPNSRTYPAPDGTCGSQSPINCQ